MSMKTVEIDFSRLVCRCRPCRLMPFMLQNMPFYVVKGYVLHAERWFLRGFLVLKTLPDTVFMAAKDITAACGYRPKNVKLPYPFAQFAAEVCKALSVNGLSLHTKNAVNYAE